MKNVTIAKTSCPISNVRINENVVRIIALLVLSLTLASILLNSVVLGLLLLADFAIRAFTDGQISPLKKLALLIASILPVEVKMVDAAPKKFAAMLGFLFSLSIAYFLWQNQTFQAMIVGGMLILCALLEAVFSFCLGCIIYSAIFRKA